MDKGPRLGAYLRHCREARGLTLEDLAAATRVRPRHLRALEDDRLDALPAPVFVRGYIRAYCASVGERPGHPLRLYEAGLRSLQPVPPPPRPPAGTGRRAAVPALIGVGLLLLGGALYLFAHASTSASPPDPAGGGGTTASR